MPPVQGRREVHTYSEEEFQTLLTGDESIVNIDRLRESARYGVPGNLRGEVWKILLGVANPDRSEEMSTRKKMSESFNKNLQTVDVNPQTARRVRQDLENHFMDNSDPFFASRTSRLKLEELVLLFVSNNAAGNYHVSMVGMLVPFLHTLPDTIDAYNCFSQMMQSLEFHGIMGSRTGKTLAKFLMLLRAFLPEVCAHFEDEQLVANEWALLWIKGLLADALPLECLLRLWDTYFSCNERWDLHIYVCLAILRCSAEDLLELECSEILNYLQNLPVLDMDQMIMHAYNIRGEVLEAKLL